jgi:putative membrane protein
MQLTHTHDHHSHEHERANEMLLGWLKTVLLLGLGIYFVYNIASGNLTNYINVRFVWLSYVAAGLFLLIGGYSAYHMLRHHSGAEHEHDHDHTHTSISWGTLALLAVPLILGTLLPSRPLGAEAVDGDLGLTSAAATSSSVTTFAINPLDRSVLDWLRVFNSSSDYGELNGQPADVIGFVYSEPTFGEDQFMVARFTISCCVADASAIGLPAYWADTSTLQQGQWVHVQGTMQVGEFRGDSLPILQASSIEVVEQPEHPYLYP